MRSDAGLVLISSLLLVAFLALVGGAFLSISALEVRIADNYSVHTELRFLSESGIEEAGGRLAASGETLTEALHRAAGADGRLEISEDLETLLASDDRPVLPEAPADRTAGQRYPAFPDDPSGAYHVFLRNDAWDGPGATEDRNGILTLVGIARMGEAARRVEADLMRRLPASVAALTLAGEVDLEVSDLSGLVRIEGGDVCGRGPVHAVGAIGETADLVARIPPDRYVFYSGAGPLPDVSNIAGLLPGGLETVAGLERLVDLVSSGAGDRLDPASGTAAGIGDVGSREAPRLVVVAGDARLGPGTGYGILVVQGEARVQDDFVWNGLVLVVGQGSLRWRARGEIRGAVLVARTRDEPAGGEPVGVVRDDRGAVIVDLGGGEGAIRYDSCILEDVSAILPFVPIAFREE